MHGMIFFKTLEELAEFLKHFAPSTALFEVTVERSKITLEFTGGY